MSKPKRACGLRGVDSASEHIATARKFLKDAELFPVEKNCTARVEVALNAMRHASLALCSEGPEAFYASHVLREATEIVRGCARHADRPVKMRLWGTR